GSDAKRRERLIARVLGSLGGNGCNRTADERQCHHDSAADEDQRALPLGFLFLLAQRFDLRAPVRTSFGVLVRVSSHRGSVSGPPERLLRQSVTLAACRRRRSRFHPLVRPGGTRIARLTCTRLWAPSAGEAPARPIASLP